MFKKWISGVASRAGIVKELIRFFWMNKMWWMIPMVVMLVAFFLLIIFAESSPVGPFIYTFF